jgi:hypothetical protein
MSYHPAKRRKRSSEQGVESARFGRNIEATGERAIRIVALVTVLRTLLVAGGIATTAHSPLWKWLFGF